MIKNGVIFLVSIFPFQVMVLKLSKKVYFLKNCTDPARNLTLFKQFTYMHLKGLHKMVLFITLTYCFGDIRVYRPRILLNFCWFSLLFNILIGNTSLNVAPTPRNHIIFWRSVMKTFRCIYVNCFKRLRFLAELSAKFQKMDFFGQFKDDNSRKKYRN